MPRRSRLHVPCGVYYIRLRSNAGQHIFSHARDYADFEIFLANALKSCRVSVHAFAWQTDAAHFAVRITDIEVGRFVQKLTAQYARNVHKRCHGSGHLFQQRHHALLIDPEVYLLRLIRHLHLLPQTGDVLDGAELDRLTSHSAYLGNRQVLWLTKVLALTAEAYRVLMETPPDPHDPERFDRGSKRDPRVLGDKRFVDGLATCPCVNENRGNLDQLIDEVCQELGVERGEVMSRSRQRKLTKARALVTHRAITRGIATLAEVARKLNRDSATLHVGQKRYH